MKRIQLFEFEDFGWLPDSLRSSMTRLLLIFHRMAGTEKVVTDLTAYVLTKVKADHITDLGSGAGGVMPAVVKALNADREMPVRLLLTDLHPNQRSVRLIEAQKLSWMNYHPEPVDATRMETVPGGLKTMIASFHHLPPGMAKQVLQSASEQKQPLLIYEVAENKIPLIAWWLFLPISLALLIIMSLFMTPFCRPLTWQQLVFTYLIPVIPIMYAWDGQASLVRTYTFDDIRELTGSPSTDYVWDVGPAMNAKEKRSGYYIFGHPVK